MMARKVKNRIDFTLGLSPTDAAMVEYLMRELGYVNRNATILAAIDALDRQTAGIRKALEEADDAP